jgi:hypothetical protein
MAYRGRHKAASCQLTKISAWVGADDWQWLRSRHWYDASAVLRRLIANYRLKIEGPREYEERESLEGLDLDAL